MQCQLCIHDLLQMCRYIFHNNNNYSRTRSILSATYRMTSGQLHNAIHAKYKYLQYMCYTKYSPTQPSFVLSLKISSFLKYFLYKSIKRIYKDKKLKKSLDVLSSVFAPLNEIIMGLPEEQRNKWERLWMVSDRRTNRIHPLIYSHPVTDQKVRYNLNISYLTL